MITPAPMPEALWAVLHSGKLEWAYRAYRRFIDELSEDVRAHLTHAPIDQEPYVVVFGKTQVGKTTLLLELMGLGTEAQARVGRVLRGGREFGKSATATTMEYRRSPDDHWYLDDGAAGRRILSDNDMCEALGELRRKMSEHRLPAEKPIVVSIPEDCFTEGKDGGIGPRMLDLPGDNPADEIERQHVELMAKRYVPHADLILLVGRGDDLSFLNPKALTLPSIDDWQFVPNRFRIITTFSFTPHTVRQFALSHKGELSTEQFRERLLQQIRTFGLPLSPEAAQTTRYFPLEFGQSWQTMLCDDSDFVRRVAPVIDSLKAQLHADIQASANEAARFRNALDVNFVTKRKRAACIAQGNNTLANLAERIIVAEATLQQVRKGEKTAAKQCKSTNALLLRREAVEAELKTVLVFDATQHINQVDGLSTNTGALFRRINDFTSWLRQHFLATMPASGDAKKFIGNSRPNLAAHIDKVNRIANDEFSTLTGRISGYSLEEYYPSLSSSFSDDKSRLRLDIRDAAAKTAKLCQELWCKHVIKRVAELEAQAIEAGNERMAMEQIAAQQLTKLKSLAILEEEVKSDMEHALARLESDAGTAARFASMLDEEYLVELRQRHVQIATASTPVDALLTLLSVHSLGEEHRKIKLS